jgi:hypothetical protein
MSDTAEAPRKFATDLSRLDHAYRARRTGQSPAEYAASVQHFRRPRRSWSASTVITLALLVGAYLIARSA